ncbi:MAG: NYN domain-containing protein [Rubrivivax sp.]
MSGGIDKVMLLIDADNVSVDVMEQAVRLLHQQHGGLHVRRAYCTAESAVKHQATFKRLGIKPMVNLAAGKNSTDIALAVDAIDLVVAERPDVVVIASSDSDFAPLVMRLREKGCVVRGIGQQGKTGDETQDVYDDFTVLAHRKPGGHARAEPRAERSPRGEPRGGGRGERSERGTRGGRGTGRGGRADQPRDAEARPAPFDAEAPADTAAEVQVQADDVGAAPPPMPAAPEVAAEAPAADAAPPAAEAPGAPRKAAAKKSSRRKPAAQAAAAEPAAPAEATQAAVAPVEAAAPEGATAAAAAAPVGEPAGEAAVVAAAEPQAAPPARRGRRGERQAPAPRAAASAPATAPAAQATQRVAPAPAPAPSKVWPDRVRSVLAALPELARGEVVSLRLATERLRDADLLGPKATSTRFFGPLAEHFELLPEDQPQQVRLKR